MPRLCELPSCSRPAEVAYGFDAPRLLIWFDAYDESVTDASAGRLCRRHAASLIPPRGWFLEDRRVAEGLLFEPPSRPESKKSDGAVRSREAAETKQAAQLVELPFGIDLVSTPEPVEPSRPEPVESPSAPPDPPAPAVDGAVVARAVAPVVAEEATRVPAWTPSFDADDDAGGLLTATTPLLSRAFTAGTRRRVDSDDTADDRKDAAHE
jgi:hypothetical protein